jgi:hypothetical protein
MKEICRREVQSSQFNCVEVGDVVHWPRSTRGHALMQWVSQIQRGTTSSRICKRSRMSTSWWVRASTSLTLLTKSTACPFCRCLFASTIICGFAADLFHMLKRKEVFDSQTISSRSGCPAVRNECSEARSGISVLLGASHRGRTRLRMESSRPFV